MKTTKISSRITKNKFAKAVRVHRTTRKIGKALGISHYSVAKYSKKWNIPLLPPKEYRKNKRAKRSAISKFIQSNPDYVFKRNYKDICAVVGCSENAARLYFSRRRREVRSEIKELGDLREVDVRLKDAFDQWYSTKDFKEYVVLFDRWTFNIFIDAEIKGGQKRRFKLKDYKELSALVLQAQKLEQATPSNTLPYQQTQHTFSEDE